MSNVLLTWELGAGAGHCVNLLPVAQHLRQKGHRVSLALRDVCLAGRIFGDLDVEILQAPFKLGRPERPVAEPRSFAHILHNTGFAEDDELRCLTDAWRNLFRAVDPSLIVFEHSPSALLASQAIDTRRVVLGTGFFSPPDVSPLPDLRPWLTPNPERLLKDEQSILDRVNRTLDLWKRPTLDRLAQLYTRIDENFLLTFDELDHYAQREGGAYWGMWPISGGATPEWPAGEGPCLFGYLRPFRALTNLLSLLSELKVRALLYVVGIDPQLRQRFESQTLRFVEQRLDISQVAQACDLAILNGNAGTATALLLQGVPSFQVPFQLEQALFSHRLVQLGASLASPPDKPERIAVRLTTMLREDRFRDSAQAFAARHADYNPQSAATEIVARIERLATT